MTLFLLGALSMFVTIFYWAKWRAWQIDKQPKTMTCRFCHATVPDEDIHHWEVCPAHPARFAYELEKARNEQLISALQSIKVVQKL